MTSRATLFSDRRFWRALTIAAAVSLATPALAQMELKIMAPAAPGGGWDQTARSMQQALVASGAVTTRRKSSNRCAARCG